MVFAILIKMAFIFANFYFNFNHLRLIINGHMRNKIPSNSFFLKKQGSLVIESIERFLDSLFVIECKAEKKRKTNKMMMIQETFD